jgi:hypothetical protein
LSHANGDSDCEYEMEKLTVLPTTTDDLWTGNTRKLFHVIARVLFLASVTYFATTVSPTYT